MPFYSALKEISPSSTCKEDEKCHYLLIPVAGFRKDDIKIQIDTFGALTVIGGRVTDDGTYIRFDETFQLPENSDIHRVTGMLEGEILHVNVPKLIIEAESEPSTDGTESSSETDGEETEEEDSDYSDATSDCEEEEATRQKQTHKEKTSNCPCDHKLRNYKAGRERTLSTIVIKTWNEHKGLVITAVLAFTAGMLISQKLQQIPADNGHGSS